MDNEGADCVAGHDSEHDEGAEALGEDGRHVEDAEDRGLEGAEQEVEFFYDKEVLGVLEVHCHN